MKNIIIILSLFVISSLDLFAQSEWFGKWQTDPMVEGTERYIMEYYFKNDSTMSMGFVTDNQINGEGRCVWNVSVDGIYDKNGPLFYISLDQESLKVSLLKFVTYGIDASVAEGQIIKQIENKVKPLFANFEDVRMIYITHDSPDTISFILGDEGNAIDMKFHRPTMTIEQQFGLDAETGINDFDAPVNTYDSEVNDITYNTKYKDAKESSPVLQLWKSFGFFMLYLILAIVSIFGVKSMFAKHLSRTKRAKRSVNVRWFYSVIRFVLRIVVIIIGFVLWVILLLNSIEVNKYIGITVLCGGGGLLLNLLSSLSLPINFMTMKKFISKERTFILYLRGFITDDYSQELGKIADAVSNAEPWKSKIDKDKIDKNPNDFPLSERCLAKAWNKCPIRFCKVFSVGRPEELESPEGTKRIYLDNDSWEEDVKTLMELAKYILVCIHPNDNCIWEIRQCNTLFSEKTIYYVDNITNLSIVRDKMGEELPVCLKSHEIDNNHMMAYLKNGETVVKPYSNTDMGLTDAMYSIFN